MRKTSFIFALLFASIAGFAQVKDPVKWTFTSNKLANGSYEVHMTATVEKGWHIYSQKTPADGPVPTAFTFARNPLLAVADEVKETGKLQTYFEKRFGVDVKQYSDKVDFVQVVTIKGGAKTSISGSVEYMSCNDKECLPPSTKTFSIALK